MIHLHWRWGTTVPTEAVHNNTDPGQFRGWGDLVAGAPAPKANKISGAPLIPPNQSLRIKVTCNNATGDNTNDPSASPAPITTDAVVVWYMATAHQPAIGTPAQFFGQGFGLAMYMETIGTWPLTEDNWELLTQHGLSPNYHNFRWKPNTGKQRVPFVQFGETGISRKNLKIPSAPQNRGSVPPIVGP